MSDLAEETRRLAIRGLFCPWCGSIAARLLESLKFSGLWKCDHCTRLWAISVLACPIGDPSQAREDKATKADDSGAQGNQKEST